MFQPHSFLWHYLWAAPNLLLAVLAGMVWRRGLHQQYRAFFLYAGFQAVQWAVLYPIDVIPSVPAVDFWRAYSASAVIEFMIVFLLISDVFAEVFGEYAALARMGRTLIRWAGAVLLVAALAVGARAPIPENRYWLIPVSHILQEVMYIVVTGLMLLLFVSAAYFRLAWKRGIFGIALGLGVSGCVHLATWALATNGALRNRRHLTDMVNMATTHAVVVMWYYYLLVPGGKSKKPPGPPPDNNLVVWNQELERLLNR